MRRIPQFGNTTNADTKLIKRGEGIQKIGNFCSGAPTPERFQTGILRLASTEMRFSPTSLAPKEIAGRHIWRQKRQKYTKQLRRTKQQTTQRAIFFTCGVWPDHDYLLRMYAYDTYIYDMYSHVDAVRSCCYNHHNIYIYLIILYIQYVLVCSLTVDLLGKYQISLS